MHPRTTYPNEIVCAFWKTTWTLRMRFSLLPSLRLVLSRKKTWREYVQNGPGRTMATTRQASERTVSTTTGFLEINDCAPSSPAGQGRGTQLTQKSEQISRSEGCWSCCRWAERVPYISQSIEIESKMIFIHSISGVWRQEERKLSGDMLAQFLLNALAEVGSLCFHWTKLKSGCRSVSSTGLA